MFQFDNFICQDKRAGGSHLCLWAEEILCSDLPRAPATAEVWVPLLLPELTWETQKVPWVCGVVKPTVKQALGVPRGTGTLCCACPAVHPLHPDPSWLLCAAAPSFGITQTIPGRARWSLELSRALIHDLILRRAITQSPVLFLAAKCRREMGLCSLIVAVPQSEAWHWHLQPRNVTLIRLGSCSGLLSVEHEPAAFRPSWLQIGVPGQVRRGPVPLPELPPP